eukprot:963913_1
MCRKRLNATQEAGVEEKEIRQDLALDSSKLRDYVLKGCLIGLLIGLVLTFMIFAVSGDFDDNAVRGDSADPGEIIRDVESETNDESRSIMKRDNEQKQTDGAPVQRDTPPPTEVKTPIEEHSPAVSGNIDVDTPPPTEVKTPIEEHSPAVSGNIDVDTPPPTEVKTPIEEHSPAVSGNIDVDNLENMTSMREIKIYGFERGDIVGISRKKPVNRYKYDPDMMATVDGYDGSVTFSGSSKGNHVFDAIYDSIPVDLWVVYSQPDDDAPRQMQKLKYRDPEAGWSLNNLGEAGVREDIDCTKCSAVVYAGSHVEVLNLEKAQGERVSVLKRRQPGLAGVYSHKAIVDRDGTAVLIPQDLYRKKDMRSLELSARLSENPVVELTFEDRKMPNSYSKEKCDVKLDGTVRVTAILHEQIIGTAITVHGLEVPEEVGVYLKFDSPGSRALIEGYHREFASDVALDKNM